MAIGDDGVAAIKSWIALGSEVAWGTYHTSTSTMICMEALSCSFKTDIKSQKIEALNVNRGPARRVLLDKEVVGTLEAYAHPIESPLLFMAALGGTCTTTTPSTGVGSHILSAGDFGSTVSITSVCFSVRKGSGAAWRYQGGRCNTLKLSAEVGQPLKLSAEMVFKDSTTLAEDLSDELSLTAHRPWTFADGVYSYTGSAEKITAFELTINNNLKSDKDARALGQNTLACLPATKREIGFKITQRLDTTTAWTRFTGDAGGAVSLVFTGESISSSNFNKLTIDMPVVKYRTPDVELKSAGDILMSDIEFDVLVDNPSTSTGYDVKFTVVNANSAGY